jgi:hypothetical protein
MLQHPKQFVRRLLCPYTNAVLVIPHKVDSSAAGHRILALFQHFSSSQLRGFLHTVELHIGARYWIPNRVTLFVWMNSRLGIKEPNESDV